MQIGHAGTLDPMATGLLIICTGRGTKAIDGFVAMQKAYSGRIRLGQTTPSYDAETDVSQERPWDHITGMHLTKALGDPVFIIHHFLTECKAASPPQDSSGGLHNNGLAKLNRVKALHADVRRLLLELHHAQMRT